MSDVAIGMDAVRELVGRVSADRDALLVALDQCRTQLTRLAGRLTMEQTRADEIEHLRAELAKAMQLAQRATSEVQAVATQLERQPSADAAVESARRELAAARSASQRVLDETRAHLEVRMDSLAAGFEAQLASVRDGLWDRVAELQETVQSSDQVLGDRSERLGQQMDRVTQRLDDVTRRLATVTSELASLRGDLQRREHAPGPLGWVVHEVAAWVGGLSTLTWAIGRYAVGAALGRPV